MEQIQLSRAYPHPDCESGCGLWYHGARKRLWDKSESLPRFLPLNLINKPFYECSWTDWHPYDPVRESKSESKLFEGHSSILSVCTF